MKKTLILMMMFLLSAGAFSQSITPEILSTSGEHYSNANAQLSWTLGELMIETESSTNNIITQGFHQPEEDAGPPDFVDENNSNNIYLNIYPNPTSDQLVIEMEKNEVPLNVRVVDMGGKLVKQTNINANQNRTELSLKHIANGSYMVHIFSEDEFYNSFYKIQKTK